MDHETAMSAKIKARLEAAVYFQLQARKWSAMAAADRDAGVVADIVIHAQRVAASFAECARDEKEWADVYAIKF